MTDTLKRIEEYAKCFAAQGFVPVEALTGYCAALREECAPPAAELSPLRAVNARQAEEIAELRAALRALRDLPDTWPACMDRQAQDDYDARPHDEANCPTCVSERAYSQRCVAVLAQADSALSTPKDPRGKE